jgi:hypothetical protein
VELAVDRAIDRLTSAIVERRCVLFVGAGIHAAPPEGSPFEYLDGQRPPSGGALSRMLAAECGWQDRFPGEDPSNLQRVSLFFERSQGRDNLVRAVREAVHVGKRPSPLLGALAELGFSLVITTNYDQLLEDALTAAGRKPRVSVYSPRLEKTKTFRDACPEDPVVYKIHGDIAEGESIVITDENYIDFLMRMNDKDPYAPVPMSLKSRLSEWTTLFVGYSLLDYNLRLLFKTLRWQIDDPPMMYSVDYPPDELIVDVWDNQLGYVKFIVQDAWSVVSILYERVLGKELVPSPR